MTRRINAAGLSTKAPTTDVAVIGGIGAAGAGATIGPAIPEVVDVIRASSRSFRAAIWTRIMIAAVIVALTLYGIYRKVRA